MSPEHFGQITEELSGDERLRLFSGGDVCFTKNKITPVIRQILAQIADCTYSGGVRKLYLESKMLELLALYLNESLYETQRISSGVKLSKEDIRSLQLAKRAVATRFPQPPIMSGLYPLICLNEFKLKKGFREMFGNTVPAFVTEQRLQHARQMLEQG